MAWGSEVEEVVEGEEEEGEGGEEGCGDGEVGLEEVVELVGGEGGYHCYVGVGRPLRGG